MGDLHLVQIIEILINAGMIDLSREEPPLSEPCGRLTFSSDHREILINAGMFAIN